MQQNQEQFHAMVHESQEKYQGLVLQGMKRMDKQPTDEERGTLEQSAVSPGVTKQSLPGRMASPTGYPPPGFGRYSIIEDLTHFIKQQTLLKAQACMI